MEYVIIGGMLLSVIGSLMSGAAKQRALNRQAAYEEAQSAIAMQDAAYDAWRVRQVGAARVGSTRVALAASGVDTGEGTAADTIAQVSTASAMEVQLAYVKGTRVAWTHKERARLLRAGVDDVSSVVPFEIASDVVNAYAQYSAIGQPANKKS